MDTRLTRRRIGLGAVLLAMLLMLTATPIYAELPDSIDNGDGTSTLVYRPAGGANNGADEGGLTGGKDTMVMTYYTNHNVNYGSDAILRHWNSNCNGIYAASYYQFDLTDLPAAAEVTKVSLVLYHNFYMLYGWRYQLSPTAMQVQAALQPWNEMSITYNTQPALSPVLASVNVPTTSTGYTGFVPIDITALYKDWKMGIRPNYGIKYSRPQPFCENGNLSDTASSDSPSESLRPRLEITYRHSTPPPVVDTTPPQISFAAPPANAAGWHNAPVTITWSVSDSESGVAASSGCDAATLSDDTPGVTVTCSATNGAGLAASRSVTVRIDQAPPVVTYSGNAGTYAVDQSVEITCAADDSLSGVTATNCADVTGPAYSFPLGANTFSAMATDLAGNIGTGSVSFDVVVTYNSLANLVDRFVTRPGIANSLQAKLRAAAAAAARGNDSAAAGIIGAFVSEVSAQAGKAISAEQAALLISLAHALSGGD